MLFEISSNFSNNFYNSFFKKPYKNIVGFNNLVICWFQLLLKLLQFLKISYTFFTFFQKMYTVFPYFIRFFEKTE